jgi:flagellar hook-associated protein 3 FlgL
MDLTIYGANQQYLFNLQATQTQIQQASAQLSSGYRLQDVSDDPSAVSQIYELQTQISLNQQTQSNLNDASGELSAADTALQSAISNVQSAISLAAEGATTTTTPETRAELATQVQGIQQALVSLSQTQVGNSYIFSGDQDTQPSYQLDPTAPEGVTQLLVDSSTRVIQDINGTGIAIARTASQIFDPQDSPGVPSAGNTFNAINSLLTALNDNDTDGITAAATSLQSASDYLNGQLAFYGEAENQVTNATSLAQKFLTQTQSNLGQVQDTDVPTASLALTQSQTQEQAALSVEAKIQQMPNLFSLLA